jgi:SAM-dependent methyltransferase
MEETPTHFSDPSTVEARRTSFGAGAATYDAVRPPWPAATVDWLLGCPAGPRRVLDLGAGTGLGTRTVAGLGHEVVAVDPSAEMLAALEAAPLAAEVSARIETRVGSAESLPDPAASYDAVTAFQAWHWFATEQAEPECARVLRPGGRLGLAWHSWSPEAAWLHELGDVVGTPEMIWDPTRQREAPGIDGFEAAENRQFAVEQRLTVDELVMLASSWSPVAVRKDRETVLDEVRALAMRAADAEGRVLFPYVSDCYRYRREA